MYQHAGLGGTFDRFHGGHKKLIDTALAMAEKVSVGVAVDFFARHKKYASLIEKYQQRIDYIKSIYQDQLSTGKLHLFPLSDPYGPTLTDNTIDCVVVTEHTLQGANNINKEREKLQMSPLPIIIADLIKDAEGDYISSTRIRSGRIGRDGKVYSNILKDTITLTKKQRSDLKNPYGEKLYQSNVTLTLKNLKPTKIAVVGDVALSTFIDQKIMVDVGVYDMRTGRGETAIVEQALMNVENIKYTQNTIINHPGKIEKEACEEIDKIIKRPHQLIKVQGEEDLLAVPLVLMLPLQSIVVYGMPNEGMRYMVISESMKEQVYKIFSH